jgi:hypothetical protein
MDFVAIRLEQAEKQLIDLGIRYCIEYSRPFSRPPVLDDSTWYVVRQRLQSDGSVCLLAVAKMGKEVG